MELVEWFKKYGVVVNKSMAILVVSEARLWAMDCSWLNVDADDILDFDDIEILNNVSVYWGNMNWSRKESVVDFVNSVTNDIDYDSVNSASEYQRDMIDGF